MTGDPKPDTKTPFNNDLASVAPLLHYTHYLFHFGLGAVTPNRVPDSVVAFYQARENSSIPQWLSSLRLRYTKG